MPLRIKAELTEQFIQSAIDTAATVERITPTMENLNSALSAHYPGDEPVLLALPGEPYNKLFSVFLNNKNVILSPSGEQLKTTGTGITFSFCGIASTGSVCISMDEKLTAPVSILTKKHITVIDSNNIVKRPSDIFSEKYLNGAGLKGSFSIVTGPSATADMGPLVRGVHGPGKLHIIVLE